MQILTRQVEREKDDIRANNGNPTVASGLVLDIILPNTSEAHACSLTRGAPKIPTVFLSNTVGDKLAFLKENHIA
jgi:hypothetical protein